MAKQCGQIHIEGGGGYGHVETPCRNTAVVRLGKPGTDWWVCDECWRALCDEGIEEAVAARLTKVGQA